MIDSTSVPLFYVSYLSAPQIPQTIVPGMRLDFPDAPADEEDESVNVAAGEEEEACVLLVGLCCSTKAAPATG